MGHGPGVRGGIASFVGLPHWERAVEWNAYPKALEAGLNELLLWRAASFHPVVACYDASGGDDLR